MRNKMKKSLSVLLGLLMLLSAVPLAGFSMISFPQKGLAADVITAENLIYGDAEGITRAEWLHDLAVIFKMTVAENSVPDNYFADLPTEHDYYDEILLNVQFGVLDIAAGEDLDPDGPVTRMFAAETLNRCLGFITNEDVTFTDLADIKDPAAAMVAVERGWFSLIDGAFLPEETITSDEISVMINDASVLFASLEIEEDYNNSYVFLPGVIVLPENTEVRQVEENIIAITDCPENISAGNTFVVYLNGIPNAYIAENVTSEDNATVISVTPANDSNVYQSIDAQGVIEADGFEVIPYEGVDADYSYEYEEPSHVGNRLKKSSGKLKLENSSLSFSKSVTLVPGVKGKVSVKIKDPTVEYVVTSKKVSVVLSGNTEINFSAEWNMIESLTGLKSIDLAYVGVPGVGGFTVSLCFNLSGKISTSMKGKLYAGILWTSQDGVRFLKEFKQDYMTLNAEAEASVSLKATLGVTKLPCINAYLYFEMGVKATVKASIYKDNLKPQKCVDFSAYLFAKAGATASIKILGIVDINETYNYDFFNVKNSPIRIHHHYEDGIKVLECTRGGSGSSGTIGDNYITKKGSKHSGSGWSGGNGAYDLNDDGVPFALYEYTLDNNNNATITAYKGQSYYVAVPETIDGYTVVGIGKGVFANDEALYSVSLPNTVTIIDHRAFKNCTHLAFASLSSTLSELGACAFQNTAIETVDIPKTLADSSLALYGDIGAVIYSDQEFNGKTYEVPEGPFFDCQNLKSVTFETGVTKIPKNLFAGCVYLKNVVIPDTVTEVGADSFVGCLSLTNLTIGESVTTIGNRAFKNCVSLKQLVLPSHIASLGACAFQNTAIETVDIPKTLTNSSLALYGDIGAVIYSDQEFNGKTYEVPEGPFFDCQNLKSVTFETGVTKIPKNLFAGCVYLKNVVIPDTVTEVGADSFVGCLSLTNLTIGESVTTIGNRAFKNCVSLKQLVLPSHIASLGACAFQNTAIETVDIPKTLTNSSLALYGDIGAVIYSDQEFNGKTYEVPEGPFFDCQNLKSVTFETGVTKIPKNLFAGCVYLKNVVIPDTVTEVGADSFVGCLSLTNLTIGESVTTIGNRAFKNCVSLKQLVLPSHLASLGACAFQNTAIETVDIPKTLADSSLALYGDIGAVIYSDQEFNGKTYSVPEGPFFDCQNLKTVTFESGVKTIPENLFAGCTGLEQVVIPDTVTIIDRKAFIGCLRLVDVTIGNGVTTIARSAFSICVSLPEITIPANVTALETGVFELCESLQNSVLSPALTRIESNLFAGCIALKTIELPSCVEEIGSNAFLDCASLESFTFTDDASALQRIGNSAFAGCTGLSAVTLPDGITKIGVSAFENCSGLASIEIPNSVTNIGNSAFKGCTALAGIALPESIKTIGKEAFYGCAALTDVVIPDYTLTAIEDRTFAECAALEELRLPKGLQSIGAEAFLHDTNFTKITIFPTVTEINDTVFSYPQFITVYGVAGTYAQTFAQSKGCTFSDISNPIIGLALLDDVDVITLEHGQRYRARFEILPENSPDCIVLSAEDQDIVRFEGIDIIADLHYGRFDNLGTCTVTAIANDNVSCDFTVNVIDAQSLRVTPPSKTAYLLGEAFDPAGMEVFVQFTNGTERFVNDYTVTGFDSSREGENVIRISWIAADGDEISEALTLNVTDPSAKINGIRIGSLPAKVTYEKREVLDLSGLTVFASYTDGTEQQVSGYTVSGYNALKEGVQTITVSYEGYTATFTVTVGTVHEHVYEPRYDNAYHWTACACGAETQRIAHTWNAGETTKAATCTGKGEKTFTCTGCPVARTDEIAALGHKKTTVAAVAPTCTKAGKTAGVKCSRCGTVLTAQTAVPATGHNYETVLTKATLTKDGKTAPTCTVCGATKTAAVIAKASKITISKAKFVYSGKVLKPTLTVKDSKGSVIPAKFYTVKWSNAKSTAVGKYTVTVTLKGNYSGKKVLTYTIVPKAVTGVKNAASTTKSIKLSWTKATGAKYYEVYGSVDGKTFKKITTVSTNTFNVTKVNGKALAAGKTYWFKVRALDATKKLIGAYSAALKTGTKTAAPKLTKLTSAKSKTATLTWGKVTGAKSYLVYRSTDGKKWTKAGTATGTSFTLTKLTGGKRVYVKVLAVNAYKANSAYSAVKYVTVKK